MQRPWIGLIGWGMLSGRMNELRRSLLGGCVVSAVGWIIAGLTMGPPGAVAHSEAD